MRSFQLFVYYQRPWLRYNRQFVFALKYLIRADINISKALVSFLATGLKIFSVTLNYGRHFSVVPNHTTRSDIIAGAFTHNLTKIDIFSNSWAPTKPFTTLHFPIKDAIEHGALKVCGLLKPLFSHFDESIENTTVLFLVNALFKDCIHLK